MGDNVTTGGHQHPVEQLRTRLGHYVQQIGRTGQEDAAKELKSAREKVSLHIEGLKKQIEEAHDTLAITGKVLSAIEQEEVAA